MGAATAPTFRTAAGAIMQSSEFTSYTMTFSPRPMPKSRRAEARRLRRSSSAAQVIRRSPSISAISPGCLSAYVAM
jgi:hypothetical protein